MNVNILPNHVKSLFQFSLFNFYILFIIGVHGNNKKEVKHKKNIGHVGVDRRTVKGGTGKPRAAGKSWAGAD